MVLVLVVRREGFFVTVLEAHFFVATVMVQRNIVVSLMVVHLQTATAMPLSSTTIYMFASALKRGLSPQRSNLSELLRAQVGDIRPFIDSLVLYNLRDLPCS